MDTEDDMEDEGEEGGMGGGNGVGVSGDSSSIEYRRNQTTAVILFGVIGALFDLEVSTLVFRGARANPIFGATTASAFSTNAQLRFASVVLYRVLGPPRLARHT